MITKYFFHSLTPDYDRNDMFVRDSPCGFKEDEIGKISSIYTYGHHDRISKIENAIYLGKLEFDDEYELKSCINEVLMELIEQEVVLKSIADFYNEFEDAVYECECEDDEHTCGFEGDKKTCEINECEWECGIPMTKRHLFKVEKHCENYKVYEFDDSDVLVIDEENSTVLIKKWNVGNICYQFMTGYQYIGSYESNNFMSKEDTEIVLNLIKEA